MEQDDASQQRVVHRIKPVLVAPNLHNFIVGDPFFVIAPVDPHYLDEQSPMYPFMQTLEHAQSAIVMVHRLYSSVLPTEALSQQIHHALLRIGGAFLSLVPLLLSFIDEFGSRSRLYADLQLQLSPEEMELLTYQCAIMQREMSRARLWYDTGKPIERAIARVRDQINISNLRQAAANMEELPTRFRMLYAEMRAINDPVIYGNVQTVLLYQFTYFTRSTRMTLPMCCSYLGAVAKVYATSMGYIDYSETDSGALTPMAYTMPIDDINTFL